MKSRQMILSQILVERHVSGRLPDPYSCSLIETASRFFGADQRCVSSDVAPRHNCFASFQPGMGMELGLLVLAGSNTKDGCHTLLGQPSLCCKRLHQAVGSPGYP